MKKAYIILIITVVVAVAVFVIEGREKSASQDFEPFVIYPKLDPKGVSTIEITYMLNGTSIKKSGDGWIVSPITTKMRSELEKKGAAKETPPQTFRADGEKVAKLLRKLGELKASTLASDNPEKRALYQVGELAKRVKLYDKDGKGVVDFYVGKNGPEPSTTYVRLEGDDKVYLVSGYLAADIPAEVIKWRNKEIWSFDPGDIAEVTVEKAGNRYAIQRGADGGWRLAEPTSRPLDNSSVEAFVKKISRIVASRFAYPTSDKEMGLLKPSLTLDVKAADGREKTLTVGGTVSQGYRHARLEGGSELYLVEADLPDDIPSDPSRLAGK